MHSAFSLQMIEKNLLWNIYEVKDGEWDALYETFEILEMNSDYLSSDNIKNVSVLRNFYVAILEMVEALFTAVSHVIHVFSSSYIVAWPAQLLSMN